MTERCDTCKGHGVITIAERDESGKAIRQRTTPCPACKGKGRTEKEQNESR